MTDPDIVTRLRESDGGFFMRQMFTESANEIERLRAERDEARRYSCDLEARIIMLEEDRRDTSNNFGTNPCSEQSERAGIVTRRKPSERTRCHRKDQETVSQHQLCR